MKTRLTAIVTCISGALLGAAGPALPQPNWYAGLALGASDANMNADVVAVTGATTTNFVTDQREPTFKVFAGYAFNRYFAVEGGFAWLGEFQATNQVLAPTTGALNAEIRVIGLFIDAVGMLPIGERFAAFAKLGVVGSETRTFRSTSGTVTPAPGTNTNATVDEPNLKYGLGVQYALSKTVTLRAEWERIQDVGDPNTGEFDLNLFYGALLFRF